jgi:clan AA aspartic protease
MIDGTVFHGREGIIRLRLHGPNQTTNEVDAVVDSGFTSFLGLRPETIAALELPRKNVEPFILGDGSVVDLATYWVELDWDGRVRKVTVQSVNDTPLIGMELMRDYHLSMEIWNGGHLRLTPRGETP